MSEKETEEERVTKSRTLLAQRVDKPLKASLSTGGWVMRSHPDVGDRVQVRSDGGSAAARKYAGKKGQVTMRGPGLDRIVVDVQIEENNFDTVFEEQDLSTTKDRKSTRLNSSHANISYAVFCLKKKKICVSIYVVCY